MVIVIMQSCLRTNIDSSLVIHGGEGFHSRRVFVGVWVCVTVSDDGPFVKPCLPEPMREESLQVSTEREKGGGVGWMEGGERKKRKKKKESELTELFALYA